MAGFYPDIPGPRMAIDTDGTVGVFINNSTYTQFTPTQMADFNKEIIASWGPNPSFNTSGSYAYIFPEARDITGVFVVYTAYYDGAEWSTNSSNGTDGTWTSFTAGTSNGLINPSYRISIATTNLVSAKAVRFNTHTFSYDGRFSNIHLYGSYSEASDRLAVWHPTLDQEIDGAYFDWGDTQRTSNATRSFRIKNTSAILTANGIDVTMEAITATTPTIPSMHTFSDGGAYASSVTVTTLLPGAMSSVITLRRDIPSNATLGVWASRIKTTTTSWT